MYIPFLFHWLFGDAAKPCIALKSACQESKNEMLDLLGCNL